MATQTDKHVCELSKELKRLLSENPSLTHDTVNGKIRCSLSGHEMPVREDAVRTYIGGKKFQKLQASHQFNYEKYQPHIVPSTKKYHEHQLFCTLTLRHINKTPTHVERHVSGGKFKRALARWEDCQKKGTVFRPNRGRRQKADNFDVERASNSGDRDEEDEQEDSDVDSLSDLYPAIDFSLEDEEVSDYDMDDMEVDPTPTKENSNQPRDKRKAEKHIVKQKKQKQKHKKQRVG